MTNGMQNKTKKYKTQTASSVNVSAQGDAALNRRIISGYFINQQSYKQMVIDRVNSFLYIVLSVLILTCVVGYYFVTMGEIKLNKIRKETLALNYENEEMQNELDNMNSYYNIDKTVSKTNMLKRAQNVIELSVQTLPEPDFEQENKLFAPTWSMGY